MCALKIGDKFQNKSSSIEIIDQDRLCYKVKSFSKGKEGIRTISKDIFEEWKIAYKKDPTAKADDIRFAITGQSEIDRFEYGYASTLQLMAKLDIQNGEVPEEPQENTRDAITLSSVLQNLDPISGDKTLESITDDKDLITRLMAGLRTKPFAILAGHSGTGKSRLVRKLAWMTCRDGKLAEGSTPGNFCMIQVKPNWHDSTELLGYKSALSGKYQATAFTNFICKAYAYPKVPFFVCLDEMNLAPVEQYFAEYLSAIESATIEGENQSTDPLVNNESYNDDPQQLGANLQESGQYIEDHGFSIPRNLFVVGTVNMDETTCQFSRKVLDRAMTIEMNETNFTNFGTKAEELNKDLLLTDNLIESLLDGERKFELKKTEDGKDDEKFDFGIFKKKLEELKGALNDSAFQIAYRFANEFALYARALHEFKGGDINKAFDHMVIMKVLPRIIGEKTAVEKYLDEIKKLLNATDLSAKKIDQMKSQNDYISFWP